MLLNVYKCNVSVYLLFRFHFNKSCFFIILFLHFSRLLILCFASFHIHTHIHTHAHIHFFQIYRVIFLASSLVSFPLLSLSLSRSLFSPSPSLSLSVSLFPRLALIVSLSPYLLPLSSPPDVGNPIKHLKSLPMPFCMEKKHKLKLHYSPKR